MLGKKGQIHFDIWQNQYNIVKLNKIKNKKKRSGGMRVLFSWSIRALGYGHLALSIQQFQRLFIV